MNKADYSYQAKAITSLLGMIERKPQKATLLAAATGSGKSYMAKDFILRYLEKYPNNNVVFFAHGQNVLKLQFMEILEETISDEFDYGFLGEGKQVSVGLPFYFNNNSVEKIDLLIVDEAHEYFNATMEQDIIKKYNPEHVLLLTGSPGIFNKDRDVKCVYISGEEMLDMDVYNSVDLDLARTDSLSVQDGIHSALDVLKSKGDNLDKIMVVCKSQMQAKIAKGIFGRLGKDVALSVSDSDSDSSEIVRFKNQASCNVLIVVNRGILGLNCKEMTSVIDLKGSFNIDIVNQYFSRLLRQHPQGLMKFFVRVSNTKNWNRNVQLLHDIKGLMNKSILKNYTGGKL